MGDNRAFLEVVKLLRELTDSKGEPTYPYLEVEKTLGLCGEEARVDTYRGVPEKPEGNCYGGAYLGCTRSWERLTIQVWYPREPQPAFTYGETWRRWVRKVRGWLGDRTWTVCGPHLTWEDVV